MVTIGDKVVFKEKLPDQENPTLQHQIGWRLRAGLEEIEILSHEHTHGCEHMEPITTTWSEFFGGLPGIVVNEDTFNHIVIVRGFDRSGGLFQVEIDPEYLVITKAGMDFS